MKKVCCFILMVVLFAIFMIGLSGCTLTRLERQSNRVAKKIERLKIKHPEAFEKATTGEVRIDTVIKKVEVQGEGKIDTVKVTGYLNKVVRDTVEVPKIIKRVLYLTKDTIRRDTLGLHLWITGSGINYRLRRDSIYISKKQKYKTVTVIKKEVVRKQFFQDVKFWILLAIALIIGFRKKIFRT